MSMLIFGGLMRVSAAESWSLLQMVKERDMNPIRPMNIKAGCGPKCSETESLCTADPAGPLA